MSSSDEGVRRLTVADIARMHSDGDRIPMLTAYDYPTAQILDEAGIPILLVGDSLGQVLLGYDSTVRVTLDEMLHHTRAVARGARRALIVGDMPFLTYATPETALDSAGRFLRDGAQAVKIEGGTRSARTVETLVRAGVPVMGHIGWTPQSQGALGGKVRVQGRTRTQARQLLSDAYSIQEAGAFSLVLELVPEQLAGAITERLSIPTIGIGAGSACSGQVQVITDLLGLGSFIPRHARPYADLRGTVRVAAESWAAEVVAGTFPGAVESVRMDDAVLAEALGRTALDRADEGAVTGSIPLDRDL
jgi:3-methyl-2-oxobutanoate hydroxymethyltransferase